MILRYSIGKRIFSVYLLFLLPIVKRKPIGIEMPIPQIPGPRPVDPLDSLIENFLLTLYQAGYSEYTVRSYGWHLYKMAVWLNHHKVTRPRQVKPQLLLSWGSELRDHYAEQTQKQAIVACKAFFNYLVKRQLCTENPADILVCPKVKIEPQRTLTLEEVHKLFDVCDDSPRGIRDRTILALMLDTGLRALELCTAKLKDLDLKNCHLVIRAKGGTRQNVYFSHDCRQILEEWLQERDKLAQPGVETVFISIGGLTPGKPLTTRGLRIIIKNIGQAAQLSESISPHAFRRTFATLRIKAGQSTRTVQVLGRWGDLKTFERYTMALLDDNEFAARSAASYSPLQKLKT